MNVVYYVANTSRPSLRLPNAKLPENMIYLLLLLSLLIGGAIGFGAAWYIKSMELAVEKRALQERKGDIDNLDARFKAVAGDLFRSHSQEFLSEFEKARTVQNVDLDHREKGFVKLVEGLNKSMESVGTKMTDLEKQRSEQFGALGQSIKHVLDTGLKMQETAQTLKTVLSSASAVRGRWGEMVLKNLLEDSGLTEGVDFFVQETVTGDEAALRPDIIVNLPGELRLAIDSKAGLEEFFKAVEEQDPDKKREHLLQFAQNLRGHIRELSSKEYQKHIDQKIPYVVMFIPGEAAVRAVFEADANLFRDAQEKKVMLASPATIIPLVLLIAHAWKQHKSVENASKIMDEVVALGGRLKTFVGHFAGIGMSLSQATKKFNEAASSWDARVYPKIEQINSLGGNLLVDAHVTSIEEQPRLPDRVLLPSSDKP